MKKLYKHLVVIGVLLAFLVAPALAKKPADDPVPNPDPGKNEYGAVPNLSFPAIATDIIEIFYQKVWVEDDPEGDDGYGVVDDSEWVLGYDADDDGEIDNIFSDGVPVPIAVTESIIEEYDGSDTGDGVEFYPGNEGFYYQTYIVIDGETQDLLTQYWDDEGNWVSDDGSDGKPDLTDPVDMAEWYISMEPWYDQPVNMLNGENDTEEVCSFSDDTICANIPVAANPNNIWNVEYLDGTEIGGENSWQAEWRVETESVIYIDFIDWGNPLENTVYPIVGQRFPVEMAIYEKVDTPMTGFNVACIEKPSTRDEVFGTSENVTGTFTKDVAFATVITKQYTAEVWNPDGNITAISLEPGIGPSGKINFASAGGGWIPTMAGWHRIWVHFNDPLIDLSHAIVNNDEHYIMSSGFMAEELNHNKLELVGIVGNSTYVDVLVQKPSGKKTR